MSAPVVVAVTADSPADRAGVQPGDRLLTINDRVPRDVIEYQLLVDEPSVVLTLDTGGLQREVVVDKPDGSPLGVEVDSALFDRVRTCDNHCEFCFIYQLPPGLRRSLYVKDDDYRLSFLYGNFTTLTRFTEADLERVLSEGLGPLYVSIHATNPGKRTEMLRNRRGATSLRWLRALLDHGVEVHGQVVVCPGLNDDAWLEDSLAGVADQFSELASLCVVPLGVSRHNDEPRMRAHTVAEAVAVVEIVEAWQERFLATLGRRLVHAADEYHLLAGRPFPPAEAYEDVEMTEDGVGMARAFEFEFHATDSGSGGEESADGGSEERASGFFRSMEGAPALGYRAPRTCGINDGVEAGGTDGVSLGFPVVRPRRDAPVGVLTGALGAAVLEPLLAGVERDDVRVLAVENRFFGGNVGVTGLMVGEDVARVLVDEPAGHRYLLPDVCLSNGRFLDGTSPEDLPHPVEVVPADGRALRSALGLPAAGQIRVPAGGMA
jgi:putative radical SAM enzyme (TIGR03279 family)